MNVKNSHMIFWPKAFFKTWRTSKMCTSCILTLHHFFKYNVASCISKFCIFGKRPMGRTIMCELTFHSIIEDNNKLWHPIHCKECKNNAPNYQISSWKTEMKPWTFLQWKGVQYSILYLWAPVGPWTWCEHGHCHHGRTWDLPCSGPARHGSWEVLKPWKQI